MSYRNASGTVIVDPPWEYSRSSAHPRQKGYSSAHYEPLSTDALKRLPIGQLGDYVFLWTTVAFLKDAFGVVESWGFKPVTTIFWVKARPYDTIDPDEDDLFAAKLNYGVGYWFRGAVEPIVVGKKTDVASVRSQFIGMISPTKGHSKKPNELHEIVEAQYPKIWLELFARRARPGWVTMGNELGKKLDIREEIDLWLRELFALNEDRTSSSSPSGTNASAADVR
jgi:N6-adenosine-specific RNA methylase IME4